MDIDFLDAICSFSLALSVLLWPYMYGVSFSTNKEVKFFLRIFLSAFFVHAFISPAEFLAL